MWKTYLWWAVEIGVIAALLGRFLTNFSTWRSVEFAVAVALLYFLFTLLNSWISDHRIRATAQRLVRDAQAGVPPTSRDYEFAITFDDSGVVIQNLRGQNPTPLAIKWAEVDQVIVFKRDLFCVDCICLRLWRADGTGLEINEEMANWWRLTEELPKHLPDCKPRSEWYPVVVLPAFATNETEIYRRVGETTTV